MDQENKDGLQTLEVWKNSREFALEIYKRIIPCLPCEEKNNLTSQIRRAAASIPANIAEGYGNYYYQSNIRFCYIARGSLEEVKSHMILAYDLGYLEEPVYHDLLKKASRLIQLINGYISYLRRAKHGENDSAFQKSIKEEEVLYNTLRQTDDQ